jgi:hypothetical protein
MGVSAGVSLFAHLSPQEFSPAEAKYAIATPLGRAGQEDFNHGQSNNTIYKRPGNGTMQTF